MRTRTILLSMAALGIWLGSSTPSHAHVAITANPAALQDGIGYEWLAEVGHTGNTGTYTGTVGAKSWNEPVNPVGSKGWTHTSDWTALDLHEGGKLTITLARTAEGGGQLTPAFTLYKGWGTGPIVWNPSDPAAGNFEWHTFNTTGNPQDTDPEHWGWLDGKMSYLDHEANPGSLNSITRTFLLEAGKYSLNFGGNPLDTALTGNHGFHATLNLAPVPIPAAVWLFGTGVIGLVGVARRRMAAK